MEEGVRRAAERLAPRGLLTSRQIRQIEHLPAGARIVGYRNGAPMFRRHDGRLMRIDPSGRLEASLAVKRVQSYLNVHG
jgi:hypothetical protein